MTCNPMQIAERYFSCMKAGDLAVVDLFHDDAILQGLGMKQQGREQIEAFYSAIIAGARPSPSPAGPMVNQGNRVMAEIEIGLANGVKVYAIDVFVVEEGRIRSLTYYTADIP